MLDASNIGNFMESKSYDKFKKAEERLRLITKNSAHSFAMYHAANDFIGMKKGHISTSTKIADDYRQDASHMAVIGLYALFERERDYSYQGIKRYLEIDELSDDILHNVIGDNRHLVNRISEDYNERRELFFQLYRKIPWKKYGSVKSFRNTVIAHLTIDPKLGGLSYNDVDTVLRLSLQISDCLHALLGNHTRDSVIDYETTRTLAFKRWMSLEEKNS